MLDYWVEDAAVALGHWASTLVVDLVEPLVSYGWRGAA